MTWIISDALLRAYENSNCSPEQEAEYSEANCSESEPSAQLNVMPTPHPFLRNDKTMDLLRRSPFGLTFARLTESRCEAVLMWFREDSRARTSVWQGEAKELTGQGRDSGVKCAASFAKFDRNSCEWKTHQLSLLGGLDSYSETWPRWGTMRNGECWERETWADFTTASEYGLSPQRFPTPTARDYKGARTDEAMEATGRNQETNSLPDYLASIGQRGPMSPKFREWLMGWPISWTDVKPLETDKFHEWQRQHSLKAVDGWELSE